MRRPTNALSHHDFVQLSQTCKPHEIMVCYHSTFDFPAIFDQYIPELTEYWQRESPELKDFPSIVHLNDVVTYLGEGGAAPGMLLRYCQTSYFRFLFSNYSLDIKLSDGTTLRQLLGTDQVGEMKLSPTCMGASRKTFLFPDLGNSLGITISIATVDEQFIIAKRSEACKSLARDKGNWLCAVGTQIKRHQQRFLGEDGVPYPHLSAQEGLKDEMGQAIAATCGPLVCTGIVYRNDFQHCELLYQTESSLRGDDLIRMWKETEVPDRREFAEILCMDVRTPDQLLVHLSDLSNAWSPQHAAGAIHYLASKFPEAMSGFGLSF
ncbi:MAG: hypothetical protein K8Q97_03990 [Candidatus Andersenbacteria bacterium]|nr:hypothetical protein [Candidatus Andersenbacteria bacterium]